MSRILLTGSTGFIGASLAPRLREKGHTIHELVRYVSGGRYNFYDREGRTFADMRDRDQVRACVLSVKPEIIINLAAQSGVSYSFLNADDVIKTNTGGTVALADAAAELDNFKLLIHASTSEVYGTSVDFPIKEDARLGATSPYSVSKIAAEEYLRVCEQIHKLPVLIMRPFNTYGRALVKNKHYAVERAITQALETQHISLHDSRPYRDFIFRDDHVNAYVLAVERWEKLVGETINVCTGNSWSIKEMANMVGHHVMVLLNKPVQIDFLEKPDRPLDIPRLQGDGGKARELLDWIPHYSFNTGIKKAVEEWAQVLDPKSRY